MLNGVDWNAVENWLNGFGYKECRNANQNMNDVLQQTNVNGDLEVDMDFEALNSALCGFLDCIDGHLQEVIHDKLGL